MSDCDSTIPDSSSSATPTSESTLSCNSLSKSKSVIQSLSSIIIPSISSSFCDSSNPASDLLHHPQASSSMSSLLRQGDSGAGNNNLCRWLYDAFQSGDPDLQLVVIRFVPVIAGLYLSRVSQRRPLAGFEAVILALYAYETTVRGGQPLSVLIPDLSHPSLYHETTTPIKNNATELNIAVISPSLEPHGTIRSTRRARIVGVILELYYSKISQMPIQSKIEFCEFCGVWAGQSGEMYNDSPEVETNEVVLGRNGEKEGAEGRIPLPWELLQPVLRIMGHCVLGSHMNKELSDAAGDAARRLYARCLHDIDPKAILATQSLLRLVNMAMESQSGFDPTEIPISNVISI